MTAPTPIRRTPHIGDAPPRDERDWLLSIELVHEAGISYRQLDYWCRTGLLTPNNEVPGSGWARGFDADQLHRAQTIRALLDAGLQLQVIRDHLDEFIDSGEAQFGPVTITIHPAGDTAA